MQELDRDDIMKALTTGVGRHKYLSALESELQRVASEAWPQAKQEATPDAMWNMLVAAIQIAAANAFSPQGAEAAIIMKQRLALLRRRAELRAQLHTAPDLEMIQ